MPYYYWKGIDLSGCVHAGKMFAASSSALDVFLFKRDIALIFYRPVSIKFMPAINKETTKQFFERFAILLRSGVLVPQALMIIRDTIGHVRMQVLLEVVTSEVERGVQLHEAMARYASVFDERMVRMVYIGLETGSLSLTMEVLAAYLQTVLTFKEKVRAAAMVPFISFLFFVLVVLVVIVLVIPTFVSVLQAVNQPLPAVTSTLLAVSNFLRSWVGLATGVLILASIILAIRLAPKNIRSKRFFDGIIIRIPFIRDLVFDMQRVWFLDSLALLVRGGMPLAQALSVAERSCTHTQICGYMTTVSKAVAAGMPLSIAFEQCPGNLFSAEFIAIVAVGENIGQLGSAIAQAAEISRARAARVISFITNIIQPMLFVLLGLLVALLILAVYTPIFTLSWVI